MLVGVSEKKKKYIHDAKKSDITDLENNYRF